MDGKTQLLCVIVRYITLSDETTQRNQQQSVLYPIYRYIKRSELKWIKDNILEGLCGYGFMYLK